MNNDERRIAAWTAYAKLEGYATDSRHFRECYERGWQAAMNDPLFLPVIHHEFLDKDRARLTIEGDHENIAEAMWRVARTRTQYGLLFGETED